MPERKEHDPMQKMRELAGRLITERLAADEARRAEARAASSADATTWEAHHASQKPDDEPTAQERSNKEPARRKACLDGVTEKLEVQGTPLTPEEKLVVSLLIANLPGEWNEYDGNDIALGSVTRTDDMLTIAFEAYGFEVGKRTLPLRAS